MNTRVAPTPEDLLLLPRWACVAFAARCARRVQPLLQASLPKTGVRSVQAVERALRLAEEVAEQAARWAPDKVVIRLHAALVACEKLAAKVRAESARASAVAKAAAGAAQAAESASCGFDPTDDDARAAEGAAAACAAALEADPDGLAAVWRDWQALATAAREHAWTRWSPVAKGSFAT